MPSKTKILTDAGLINPPRWLPENVCYETITGSVAYGVSNDTSDMDVYGFAMPPKDIVFPHLSGHIKGFSQNVPEFEQFQQHHIDSPTEMKGKGRTYDLTIFSIIKFFYLLRDNNPNVLDSVWTPQECVLHSTKIGNMVRDNRKLFVHKGVYHKMRGYAFSQIHRVNSVVEKDVVKNIRNFEKSNGIDHTTRFLDVKNEMKKRGLLKD